MFTRTLSQKQTAERLGIAPRTLRLWVQDGYFPQPHRIGRTPYYSEQTVNDWIGDQLSAQ